MSREQEWESRYQAGRLGWDWGEASPAQSMLLAYSGVEHGRVLIPGAGRGHEVIALAKRRFEVTALEIAPSAVAYLRTELAHRNLNADVIQTDMLQWDTDNPFDAIYEQTSLCALHPETWGNYENKLFNWLKPGGLLFALWIQTHTEGGPPYHCDLTKVKEYFSETRWEWSKEIDLIPHPSGRYELAYVLRRKE